MIKRMFSTMLFVGVFALVISSCSKDDEETTGFVKGVISSVSDDSAIANALVILYDANTNESTGLGLYTGSDGAYSFEIKGGNYYLKVSAQGYKDVPTRGFTALPFTVVNGQTLENPVEMEVSDVADAGSISGMLTNGDGASLGGALVIASANGNGYSTISDGEGNFVIFNVPAATYSVKAWRQGLDSESTSVVVSANSESSQVDIPVVSTSGKTVSGSITFLAGSAVEVDVSLTNMDTGETIPGLVDFTTSNYTFSNVGDGTYLARATYANDGKVVDPDWIVKFGEPIVTVSGASVEQDFSLTGATILTSPTNPADEIIPEPTSATPTFTWVAYSSASDYVIEVSTSNGDVIWGGFSSNFTVKNVVVEGTSIEFNSDGTATQALEPGKIYKWKVYTSKDDTKEPTGWKLISMSEDQMGIIIIE